MRCKSTEEAGLRTEEALLRYRNLRAEAEAPLFADRLNADVILSILYERKPNEKEKYVLKAEKLRPYCPGVLHRSKPGIIL